MRSFKYITEVLNRAREFETKEGTRTSIGGRSVLGISQLSDGSSIVMVLYDINSFEWDDPDKQKGRNNFEASFARIPKETIEYDKLSTQFRRLSINKFNDLIDKYGDDTQNDMGLAFEAFATVKKFLDDYVATHSIDRLVVKSSKFQPSRVKLYRRFVKKYAKGRETREVVEDKRYVKFTIAMSKRAFEEPKPRIVIPSKPK